MGIGGQFQVLAALLPGERPGINCTGGSVSPRAFLNTRRESRTHWDSIPGPSSDSLYHPRYPDPWRDEMRMWQCTAFSGVSR